jgi:phospholipase C
MTDDPIETTTDPIKHVIVVMLENRSFDHMLGCLSQDLELDGIVVPPRQNSDDQNNIYSQVLGASPVIRFDPHHELEHVQEQLQGGNLGFVKDFARAYPASGIPDRAEILLCQTELPALHTLARGFTVCDHWFASVPGPTWCNRFFVHSGTSLGRVKMPNGILDANLHWYDQTTLYDRLNQRQKCWAIYYGDVPQSLILVHQLEPSNAGRYKKMIDFFLDVAGAPDDFPDYCFIEPAYYQPGATDDHPTHNVFDGDRFISEIYNAVRANDALWESSLLIILFDEHGGFYDHVVPPPTVAPDHHTEEYTFDQLGLRVPAILVSPYVQAGRVFSDVLDHTSLLKYLTDKWNLGPLGARTAQANSFAKAIGTTPQLATPPTVPAPTGGAAPPPAGRPELSSHQSALFAITQLLESVTDVAADSLKGRIQRIVTGFDGVVDVAVDRVEAFLSQARANQPSH